MRAEVIHSPPELDWYLTLEEHQTKTPVVFFNGKPVLHYLGRDAVARVPLSQCGLGLPFFGAELLAPADKGDPNLVGAESESTAGGSKFVEVVHGVRVEMVEQKVDVFVTSHTFTIWCPSTQSGIQVPYPSISIHGIQSVGVGPDRVTAVWTQLELGDLTGAQAGGYESGDPIDMTLFPAVAKKEEADQADVSSADPSSNEKIGTANDNSDADGGESNNPTADLVRAEVHKLYAAITACADLHPGPAELSDDDEETSDRIIFDSHRPIMTDHDSTGDHNSWTLPPSMPGSSGWITAENVHEFFGPDGEWLGPNSGAVGTKGEEPEEDGGEDWGISGELGSGAGHVRPRAEFEEAGAEAGETEAKIESEASTASGGGGHEDGSAGDEKKQPESAESETKKARIG